MKIKGTIQVQDTKQYYSQSARLTVHKIIFLSCIMNFDTQ